MFEAQIKWIEMTGHKHMQIFIRMASRGKVAGRCVSTHLIEVELC